MAIYQGQTSENSYDGYPRDWWNQKGDDAAKSITSVLQVLKRQQRPRIRQLIDSTRLYGNLALFGPYGPNQVRLRQNYGSVNIDRVTFNLIQAVVDTIVSRLGAKNKPKPYFLTSGGTYKDVRKAKKLNKFIDGMFQELKVYDLGVHALKMAAVHHDGIVHVFEKDGRVAIEIVPANEILIDEVQAIWGKPRQWHRVHAVDQLQLEALFPGKVQQIRTADKIRYPDKGIYPGVADMIEVRESWHLRSGAKKKDGKHVITCEKFNLIKVEDYEEDFFPFAVLPWSKRLHGYWAQSLAEQLENLQINVNRMLMVISRTLHLAGTFKIFLKQGSKVSKEHLTNELGLVITYSGETPPKYETPPVLQPEWWETIDKFIERAFDQSGISMMSASSRIPEGITSGTAIRSYDFIETDRFQERGRQYENLFLDIAKISLSVASQIVERDGKYEVKTGKKFLQVIDLTEILEDGFDIHKDSTIQVFPISALVQEPTGRWQQIQEWIQAGFIDPRTGHQLMSFPDIERIDNLQDAMEEWVLMVLEKMVDDGIETDPETYMDLDLAMTLALQFYAYGQSQDLPEDRLDMLRSFMEKTSKLKKLAAPSTLVAAPGVGPPQANPSAPPVSNMIPNVPAPAGVS